MSSESTATFLGKELRRARMAAGLSQDQLAQRLGWDRSTITRIETGDRVPSPDLALALDTVFPHLDGLFSRLAEHARSADGPVPGWFEEWLAAERSAQALHIWQPLIVPGLFQTAAYARRVYVAGRPGTSDDELDTLVEARLVRRAIFDRPEPPHCVVVLDESVLRRQVGTPQGMHEQLMHLAEMADQPYMTLQVVPTVANVGLRGGFVIASAHGTSDVVLADALEDVTSGSRTFVRNAAIQFDVIRGETLNVAQSRSLLMEVAEWYKNQL